MHRRLPLPLPVEPPVALSAVAALGLLLSALLGAACQTSGTSGGTAAAGGPDAAAAVSAAPATPPPGEPPTGPGAASGAASGAQGGGTPAEGATDDLIVHASEPAPPAGPGYELLPAEAVTLDADLREPIESMAKAGQAKAVLDQLTPRRDRAVPALRRALRHPEQNVRIQAAMVLARLSERSRETTQVFAAALLGDPSQEVRAAVGRELIQYRDPALVPALERSLAADPYETARANAAWALGEHGRGESVDALVKALGDEATWVRLRSLTALRKLKARKALPAIVERVRDSNALVRERAVDALRKITGKKIGEDYERWKKAIR
jgi:HEAT repeat protein